MDVPMKRDMHHLDATASKDNILRNALIAEWLETRGADKEEEEEEREKTTDRNELEAESDHSSSNEYVKIDKDGKEEEEEEGLLSSSKTKEAKPSGGKIQMGPSSNSPYLLNEKFYSLETGGVLDEGISLLGGGHRVYGQGHFNAQGYQLLARELAPMVAFLQIRVQLSLVMEISKK